MWDFCSMSRFRIYPLKKDDIGENCLHTYINGKGCPNLKYAVIYLIIQQRYVGDARTNLFFEPKAGKSLFT